MDLVNQFKALEPAISELLKLSGSPALSFGVVHRGTLLHTAHFGLKHTEKPSKPADDSLYHIASLVKLLTAGVVAHLVHEGTLQWDTPVSHYLPELKRRSDALGQEATVRDFLSHRTGLAVAHASNGQQKAEFLIPRSETLCTAASLEAVAPFREQFVYSQWNYSIITDLVEKVSGQSFDVYVKRKFLDRLGMVNTHFSTHGDGENDVRGHAIRNDITAIPILSPGWTGETGFAGAAGCKSSLADLLRMYQSFLASYTYQQNNNVDSAPGSPWKFTRTILEPHIEVGTASIEQVAYCLGIYRLVLPTNLSVASLNQQLFNTAQIPLPIFGDSHQGLKVYHHTAAVPGFHGSMFLLPSTESAVVVLTNSLPLVDATDFTAQLVLSVLLGEEPRTEEFLELAKIGQPFQIMGYQLFAATLEKKKTDVAPSLPLYCYEGDYWNKLGVMAFTIVPLEDQLRMTVKGKSQTSYDLLPYDGDTFYWRADREWEMCEKGMWPFFFAPAHKIRFKISEDGKMEQMIWHHDPLGTPETFVKKADANKANL